MDVTQFLNSKAIARHLREIDYQFSLPEAACIVYDCHAASLDQKIRAWEYLIDTYPDCSMEKRPLFGPIESFQDFLRNYIDLKKQQLAEFRESNDEVYLISLWEGHGNGPSPSGYDDFHDVVFTSYDRCFEYLKTLRGDFAEDDVRYYKVVKTPLNQPKTTANDVLHLDRDLNVLAIEIYGRSDEPDLDKAFTAMWLDIPTPFHRGDLLVHHDLRRGDIHLVLADLFTWDSKRCFEEGVDKPAAERADRLYELNRERGDHVDMSLVGYYVLDDGSLDRDVFEDYLNLDTFDEGLEGQEQILEQMHLFMIGEIDESQFLASYWLSRAEREYEMAKSDWKAIRL